jgi:HD-like signal output (HDOD) protein
MHNESQAAVRFVRQVDQLHSMPLVATRLLKLTRAADYDIREVVACLESDPALVAKILRTVNSAFFGLRHQVGDLQQAVALLGHRSLRLLAMTFVLVEGLTRGAALRLVQDYWRRALTMALAARRLAHDRREAGDAYSAGLLADLGVLVFAQFDEDGYWSLCRDRRHDGELIHFERQRYGCGHPTLGAELLDHWGAPAALVEAVRAHHETPAEPSSLAADVYTANLLADTLWTAGSPSLAIVRAWLDETRGLDVDGLIDLCRAVQQDLAAESAAFNVRLDEPLDCERLLAIARRQHAAAALETACELDSLTAVLSDHTASATPEE